MQRCQRAKSRHSTMLPKQTGLAARKRGPTCRQGGEDASPGDCGPRGAAGDGAVAFSCAARRTPPSAFLGRTMAPHCEGRPGHDLLEQKAIFVICSIFTYSIRLLLQFKPKNCPLNWNVPDAFGWTYAKRLLWKSSTCSRSRL